MECLECDYELDLSPGHEEMCPECNTNNYRCYQCEEVSLNEMLYDDEVGFVCDSCREENEEFFSDRYEPQDTDYSWGLE